MSKSPARRPIFEWDGRDYEELLRQVRALPPGRYAVVPEEEILVDDAELELTPDEVDGLNQAIDRKDRGESAVTPAELRRDLLAHVQSVARKP